jgi:CRP/FNR family transcriptional regulator, cyclic AMP receptor protein
MKKEVNFPLPPASGTRTLCDCAHCEHRSLRLFCNLDADAFAEFDSLGVHSELTTGATIFEEETPVGGVFVICNGRVKLSSTSRQGKTLILKIALPGDVLGLGAVMSGSRYEVTAEAIEPTQLKMIPRVEFLAFVHKYGEASLHAAQALSEEYRTAFFDVRRLALSVSAASRLASLLLEWGRAAAHGKTEMRFTMALTHEDLANLIGTSRETVTRMLGKFKRDKLILMRGATIVILAPDKLELMAA